MTLIKEETSYSEEKANSVSFARHLGPDILENVMRDLVFIHMSVSLVYTPEAGLSLPL